MRIRIAALAALFLAAHLLHLPPTLEDIDSINFALGVREFDVGRHQPHPPGYPLFIGLARGLAAALRAGGATDAIPTALATLSATAGALLVPLSFALYRRLSADPRLAWWAMALAVSSPLVWFTALRPLSDTTGLAFATGAQVALAAVIRPGAGGPDTAARSLLAGAALSGLAAGVRIQTVMLTAPLLALALALPAVRVRAAHRALALAAAAAGALAWGVPLVAATGGLSAYLTALGTQAGEDFSGVVMLWTSPTPRVARDAIVSSFILPWGGPALGAAVLVLAAAGTWRILQRDPRVLLVLGVAFGPYAVFHMLFQETATTRYSLPLVLPMAFLAASGGAIAGRAGTAIAGGTLAAAMLMVSAPAARAFGQDGSPAFRAFQAVAEYGAQGRRDTVGMHAVMRRVEQWERDRHRLDVLGAPHGREWLALVEHWRAAPDAPVRFLADPRRTDLALFDGRARRLDLAARWTFPPVPFVGGSRPGATDVYSMQPPDWMLDRGWALTAEIGGVTARDGLGPHRAPSVAWVRARQEEALLLLGGRNLGAPDAPSAQVRLEGPRGPLAAFEVPPGFFFRVVEIPAGALAGPRYVPLRAVAASAGAGPSPPVALEQFDLQSGGVAMVGFVEGWGEPEYDPGSARAWRWMSERGTLWVRPVGRDVRLEIEGESPLRYFDRAPSVRVTVAGREVAAFSPPADFTQVVPLPGDLLDRAAGLVIVESDLWFSPAQQGGADPRHLALRTYRVSVR